MTTERGKRDYIGEREVTIEMGRRCLHKHRSDYRDGKELTTEGVGRCLQRGGRDYRDGKVTAEGEECDYSEERGSDY